MANSVNVQQSLRLNCVIDSDASSTSGTPLTVFCSRQLTVVDFKFCTSALSANNDGALLIESLTSAGAIAATLGSVDASADSGSTTAVLRPTTITLSQGANTSLSATASVARGNTLRVRAAGTDNGTPIRATGTITVLPGARYAAGAGTYFPNNGSTGAGGSSATSI